MQFLFFSTFDIDAIVDITVFKKCVNDSSIQYSMSKLTRMEQDFDSFQQADLSKRTRDDLSPVSSFIEPKQVSI